MKKSDLITELASREKLTEKQAVDIVNQIFNGFTESLLKGEKVEIRGFGSFSIRNYRTYTGRNPKTGEKIPVKQKRLPFFKVGKGLIKRLNHITPEKVHRLLNRCNSYNRLPTLFGEYYNKNISEHEFFLGLRDNWSTCDNISAYRIELEGILNPSGAIYFMMNNEEQKFYEGLPEIVTIYRGCDEQNTDGICWSLDRDIAIEFPFLDRYKAKIPVLVTATISKDEIVAVKLDRDELEVIAFYPEQIKITPLSESDRNPEIAKKKHLELMAICNKK